MTKLKIKDSVFNILVEGLRLYCKNILKFTKYMLFPVFGQVFGIMLIFALTGWVGEKMLTENLTVFIFLLILASVPGFVIFFKAFWDFLVAYGALNSMAEAIVTTGKLYDLKAHTQIVTNRSFKFVVLLFTIAILSTVAILPPFWALGIIFFVYFILLFQVFTFETDASVFDCYKKSLFLIKGNFGRTVALMLVLTLLCYFLLNWIFSLVLDVVKISDFFRGIFENWAITLPLDTVNALLAEYKIPFISPLQIANEILSSSILFITAGLSLPLRSIVWSLWYKNLISIKSGKGNKQ